VGRAALIVDAGPLFAVFDTRDAHHGVARRLLESHPGPLLVPSLVLAEAGHLVGARLGARAEVLLAANLAQGVLFCEPVHPADWLRIAELAARYADLPLGLADASLVAAAERLGIVDVASFDEHLRVVRPAHAEALNVLP
jgi:predicted nucleic acid-binding protein